MTRWPGAPGTVAVAGLGLGVGLGVGLSGLAVRRLARGRTYELDTVPERPVALVLGAQVFTDGTPSPFLAARLDLARRLYAAGRVRRLLLSGDGAAREYDEPAAMRRYLLARGVPDDVLTLDRHGVDSYDSCWRARYVYDVGAVTVVSQSYHLPRALAIATVLGLDPVGVGDERVAGHRAWRKGVVREQLAAVKAVFDLASGRPARTTIRG